MGQRPKGSYRNGSSYLLQQLIHRYQESDADKEEYREEAEEEVESEESSESEMLNLEVCLLPTPHPLFSSPGALLLQQQLPGTPLTRSPLSPSLRLSPPGARLSDPRRLPLSFPFLLLLSSSFAEIFPSLLYFSLAHLLS